MFAFVKNDSFLEQPKGVIFSCPSETQARKYHKNIPEWSLYRLKADLSVAYLVEGDGTDLIYLSEEQKFLSWSGYVYKSLLDWAPYPEEINI